jgi:hypothetical protein
MQVCKTPPRIKVFTSVISVVKNSQPLKLQPFANFVAFVRNKPYLTARYLLNTSITLSSGNASTVIPFELTVCALNREL